MKKIELGAAAGFGNNNLAKNLNNLDLLDDDFNPRAGEPPTSPLANDFGPLASAPSNQATQ